MGASAIDIGRMLASGGEQRVALLRFCVMSVRMEPVFVFLTGEYRLRPDRTAALALYDVFCAPGAPARIEPSGLLPPRDLRLVSAIETIRRQQDQIECRNPAVERDAVPITTPYGHLFEFIAAAVRNDPAGHYAEVSTRYDPNKPPEQSLDGGRMNAGQRHFVDKIWRPIARPRLAAAGFWQISTIE